MEKKQGLMASCSKQESVFNEKMRVPDEIHAPAFKTHE